MDWSPRRGRCMLSLALLCCTVPACVPLDDRPFFPRREGPAQALVDLEAWRRGQEQPVARIRALQITGSDLAGWQQHTKLRSTVLYRRGTI
jgi:hypothetical protein